MKFLESFTYIDAAQGKGIDVTFIIENNRVVKQHVEPLRREDWGGINGER